MHINTIRGTTAERARANGLILAVDLLPGDVVADNFTAYARVDRIEFTPDPHPKQTGPMCVIGWTLGDGSTETETYAWDDEFTPKTPEPAGFSTHSVFPWVKA